VELLKEKEASAVLNVSQKTLQAWRYRGGGPKFVKVGRAVRYMRDELNAFIQAHERTSTSDQGKAHYEK
jgi:excisionase family DNA binding protein